MDLNLGLAKCPKCSSTDFGCAGVVDPSTGAEPWDGSWDDRILDWVREELAETQETRILLRCKACSNVFMLTVAYRDHPEANFQTAAPGSGCPRVMVEFDPLYMIPSVIYVAGKPYEVLKWSQTNVPPTETFGVGPFYPYPLGLFSLRCANARDHEVWFDCEIEKRFPPLILANEENADLQFYTFDFRWVDSKGVGVLKIRERRIP